MSERSESFFAALLPAIAVAWVIADATVGLAAAERTFRIALPTMSSESADETAAAVDLSGSDSRAACASRDLEGSNSTPLAMQKQALRGLCEASGRFTAVLPSI